MHACTHCMCALPRHKSRIPPTHACEQATMVLKAVCRHSGVEVALKVYDEDKVGISALRDVLEHQTIREIDIHAGMDHPNVTKLYAAFRQVCGT